MSVTIYQIREACGYSGYDSIWQSWAHLFGRDAQRPQKDTPLEPSQAQAFLTRLATPYPGKPQSVIEGARKLLEQVSGGGFSGSQFAPAEKPSKTKNVGHQPEMRTRAERLSAEQKAQADYAAAEEARAAKKTAVRKRFTPWVTALTIALNVVHIAYLSFGLWRIAGDVGALVGAFLAALCAVVLLTVQMPGDAGAWAVAAWAVVCVLAGWLVSYPSMLSAITDTASIVDSNGKTLSGISAQSYATNFVVLLEGSSFVGTYLRYQITCAEHNEYI